MGSPGPLPSSSPAPLVKYLPKTFLLQFQGFVVPPVIQAKVLVVATDVRYHVVLAEDWISDAKPGIDHLGYLHLGPRQASTKAVGAVGRPSFVARQALAVAIRHGAR